MRGIKFLLRSGQRAPLGVKAWTERYMRWLAQVRYTQLAQEVTLLDCRNEVEHMSPRVQRLEEAILEVVKQAPQAMQELIRGLQALSGAPIPLLGVGTSTGSGLNGLGHFAFAEVIDGETTNQDADRSAGTSAVPAIPPLSMVLMGSRSSGITPPLPSPVRGGEPARLSGSGEGLEADVGVGAPEMCAPAQFLRDPRAHVVDVVLTGEAFVAPCKCSNLAMERLKGKRALITGGSSGIGLETAKQFITEGA